ncbi:hypothetical protein pdam_00024183, partial [Pocillopora damicornis]
MSCFKGIGPDSGPNNDPLGTLGFPSYCHYTKGIISSSKSWKGSPVLSSLHANQVLDVMLKSRADATAKSYMRVFKKFLDWCKSKQISFELPFPLGVVSLYLFEVQHLDCNPLDSDFCRNIIESAKRQRSQPIVKKKPITTEIVRNILDVHNKEHSNLKDLRIAALCSLAFAGFL